MICASVWAFRRYAPLLAAALAEQAPKFRQMHGTTFPMSCWRLGGHTTGILPRLFLCIYVLLQRYLRNLFEPASSVLCDLWPSALQVQLACCHARWQSLQSQSNATNPFYLQEIFSTFPLLPMPRATNFLAPLAALSTADTWVSTVYRLLVYH